MPAATTTVSIILVGHLVLHSVGQPIAIGLHPVLATGDASVMDPALDGGEHFAEVLVAGRVPLDVTAHLRSEG